MGLSCLFLISSVNQLPLCQFILHTKINENLHKSSLRQVHTSGGPPAQSVRPSPSLNTSTHTYVWVSQEMLCPHLSCAPLEPPLGAVLQKRASGRAGTGGLKVQRAVCGLPGMPGPVPPSHIHSAQGLPSRLGRCHDRHLGLLPCLLPLLCQSLHLLLQFAQDMQVRLVLLGILLQLNHTLV